jgi:uncharacterized protein (DUF4415 family)
MIKILSTMAAITSKFHMGKHKLERENRLPITLKLSSEVIEEARAHGA